MNNKQTLKYRNIHADFYLGDCLEILRSLPADSVDLTVTSPPYSDQRRGTYGGIHPDDYVDWFLPITKELLRVTKPTGTFILNIKEKVTDGERHTYVLDMILRMRKLGWLWTEEFIWHKKNCHPGNGQTGLETHGNDCFSLIRQKSFLCIKTMLWYR